MIDKTIRDRFQFGFVTVSINRRRNILTSNLPLIAKPLTIRQSVEKRLCGTRFTSPTHMIIMFQMCTANATRRGHTIIKLWYLNIYYLINIIYLLITTYYTQLIYLFKTYLIRRCLTKKKTNALQNIEQFIFSFFFFGSR